MQRVETPIRGLYQAAFLFTSRPSGLTESGRLAALESRSSRLLTALESNEPIEVSKGIFLDQHPAIGNSKGKDYEIVARNYRPDHLAILLEPRGACSLDDGCGVLARNALREKALAILNCGRKKLKKGIEPLLNPIMNFGFDELETVLPQSIAVANARGIQPLRMPTMEFGEAKPTTVLTRSKLLEVANARGIEPLLMPTMNFEIEKPDEPYANAKVPRKKSGIEPLVMPTMNFDIPTPEED